MTMADHYLLATEPKDIGRTRLRARVSILLVAILISNAYLKLLGGGQSLDEGGLQTQSALAAMLSRASVVIVLILAFYIVIQNRALTRRVYGSLLYWAPLVLIYFISMPFDQGSLLGVVFRIANNLIVLFSCILLVQSPVIFSALLDRLNLVATVTSALGLALYFSGSPFAYFTDGYNEMFTGLFGHKAQVSVVASYGIIYSLYMLSRRFSYRYIAILLLQLVTLITASTLSNFLGLALALMAFVWFRPAILSAGLIGILIPVLAGLFAPFFLSIGKDPTLTGRTILWAYAVREAMQDPILGHGFVKLTANSDFQILISRLFKTDNFEIPHSHNLWIETFFKFGVMGWAAVAFQLVVGPLLKPADKHNISWLAGGLLAYILAKGALVVPFYDTGLLGYLAYLAVAGTIMGKTYASMDRA
jgi:O-antigen ligase